MNFIYLKNNADNINKKMEYWDNIKFEFKEFIKDVDSFDKFQDKMCKLPNNKTKGDYLEYFSKMYFTLQPYYNIKTYYLYSEIPEKLMIHTNLPLKDKGIDGLAINHDDSISAVQVKFRSNYEDCIPWQEISTFTGLTFGTNVKNIEHGIFFTNCVDVCAELKNTKYTCITQSAYDKCNKQFWDNVRNRIQDIPIIEYIPKQPYDYQQDIIQSASEYYKNNRYGRLYMPCGTGKSLTSYWITHEYDSIFICVPSLYLLNQIYETWKTESIANKDNKKYLLLGSDIDLHEKIDALTEYTLTTDQTTVTAFLKQNDPKVIITTYHSSWLLMEACQLLKYKFDLGVYDEAHVTVGKNSKMFNNILKKDLSTKRLFMTATEKIYNYSNSTLTKEEIEKVVSMNNEIIYGKIIREYTTRQAIENGQLVDYKLMALSISNNKYRQTISDNLILKLKDYNIDTETCMMAIAVLNAFHNDDCKFNHVLIFSSRNKRAEMVYKAIDVLIDDLFPDFRKDIYMKQLSGKDNMNKRQYHIKRFQQAKNGILCSARILGVGVDIKQCDAVVFADSKESTIDIVQYACRCMRLCSDKPDKIGHIFVPFVINTDDEDKFYSIECKNYNKIRRILKALGTTDDRIQERFSVINGLAKGVQNKDDKHDVDEFVNLENDIDLQDFALSILVKVFNRDGQYTLYDEWKKLTRYVVTMNISHKNMYYNLAKLDNKLCPNPDEKFRKYWTNWYDFLNIDISGFLQTKKEWKDRCIELNIKSWDDYIDITKTHEELPLMMGDLYRDFTNFIDELGLDDYMFM